MFNLQRLQARTKTFSALLRDLLCADDCFLLVHEHSDAQRLFDKFRTRAVRFGLTVSLKKTEVTVHFHSASVHMPPAIFAGEVQLPVTDKFC